MAISKLFKKDSAPEELPDLAIDELKKDLKKDYSEKKEEPKAEEKVIQETQEKQKEEKKDSDQIQPNEVIDKKVPEPIAAPAKNEQKEIKVNENSYFNPLIKELKKDNFDPSKIEGWYQRTFSEKSAIEGMKEYWEQQKDEFITESIEKEFKERINEKMLNLQKLEGEWQQIYIGLIQKEEEMKKEEKNIKKIIKDFSEVVKKKGNIKKRAELNN